MASIPSGHGTRHQASSAYSCVSRASSLYAYGAPFYDPIIHLKSPLRGRFRKSRQPTLAIVCGTHMPGPLVAGCIRPLRRIANEVIIGADERVPAEDLRWYGTVADVLLTFPFTGPNQFRGWLRDQCRSDWILFLDGDETPSAALIDRIPELMRDRDIAAYRLRRRWVYPDSAHVLDSLPWSADFQTRLVRNDDRLWFPSLKHTGPESAGPIRRVDEPILHLDLVVTSRTERERKVEKYESEHFGHMSRGWSTNRIYYLPEASGDIRLIDLPAVDKARVERVMVPPDEHRPVPRRRARIAKRAAVDDIMRTLPQYAFVDADARAEITVLRSPQEVVPAGSRFTIDAIVRNCGGRTWPGGTERLPAVRFSYQWRNSAGQRVVEGIRTMFPHAVRPGESVEVECLVQVPLDVAGMVLVFDVLAECDRWFGVDLTLPVQLGPSTREQLATQSIRGLVPLSAVLDMRRLLKRPSELEMQISDPDPQVALPDQVARRVEGLPIGVWALDAGVLDILIRTYNELQPEIALEFGSGTSTVVLALLAEQAGRSGLSVISFEQDPDEAQRVRGEVDRRGLGKFVRIVVAPLTETAIGRYRLRCYDPAIIDAALDGVSPSLILVDGRSTASGGNRFPTLLLLQQHLRSSATFILDDAWRDMELTIAERWQECDGIEVDGIALVGKGAVLGRIEPVASD